RMPYRSRHSLGHRLVDRIRYQSIVESLPYVDSPVERRDVESPTPIEEFSVAHQPVGTVCKAFGACVGEGRCDLGPKQDLPVVVVDGFSQLFDETPAEVLCGYADGRVHEAEAGLEA